MSGRVTLIVWLTWWVPGVTSRFLPWASALLMVAAVVPGRTMKKSASESEEPAGVLLYQLVPVLFCRTAGTNTRYSPLAK